MGLDTTHNAWHGPYSSFNGFREWLAAQIGFNLREMEGFGGNRPFSEMDHKIKPLLNHSDCDGELTVQECEQVAEGLKAIIDMAKPSPEDDYYIVKAEQFRKGCLLAVSKNENIEFR